MELKEIKIKINEIAELVNQARQTMEEPENRKSTPESEAKYTKLKRIYSDLCNVVKSID